MKKENARKIIGTIAVLITFALVFISESAFAQAANASSKTANSTIESIIENFSDFPLFLNIGAYLIGIWFAITGLLGIKNANESGGRSPLKNPLFRLLIGGFLLSMATLLNYLVNTVEVAPAAIAANSLDSTAEAQTLGSIMVTTMGNIGMLPLLLSAVAYFSAIYFAISAMLMLQAFIEDPAKNPVSKAVMRFLGAGFLLTLPTVMGIAVNTVGGDSSDMRGFFGTWCVAGTNCAKSTTNNGLDAILANIVNNIAPPLMQYALPAFCYFVGILFITVCIYRLAQASNDKSRSPGSFGTWTTLFVGAAFLSFAHMVAYSRGTIFGAGDTLINQMNFVSSSPMDPQMQARAENALSAVLIFLRIVGYISFARGLFILRAFGEGKQGGSVMGAVTHIVAGGMLANLGSLLKAVQNTTGISVFNL